MTAYDWICPKVPENLRDHHRSSEGVYAISQLEPERPRVCFVTAVYTPLMRPIEFIKEFSFPPGDAEWLARQLLDDIERAFTGECDHQFPHLLINLKSSDSPQASQFLFYPCEATRLVGEEKGQRVLNDLAEDCRQVIEQVKHNDN